MSRRLLLLLMLFALSGCAPAPADQPGQINIYLPAQSLSGRDILAADLSKLALQSTPLIPASEILSYSRLTHDLTLAPTALERLAALRVPVNGLGFVVCLDEAPLFAGAFWTPISSLSFEGLTIEVLMDASQKSVHLYSGYPRMDAPLPNDPRENPRFLGALEEAGKLR
jgi:hypothetical protein